MREFIILTNSRPKDFDINNMPGDGRYDLIARCIREALWLSGSLRNSKIHIIMNNMVMSFDNKIKRISPDERSIGLWIKKIISGGTNPGISFVPKNNFWDSFESRNCYVLDRYGKKINNILSSNPVFILGGHKGFTEEVSIKADKISLGNKEYLTSQCITILNWLSDGK